MINANIPKFALVTIDKDGNHLTNMYHTEDVRDVAVSKLPITAVYYKATVTNARVFGEVSVTGTRGRKPGTANKPKEKTDKK